MVSLLLIILLPLSFQNVEYFEVAFFKRRTTGTISRDKVFAAGRHMIGPDAMFVKFPASEQTVDFKDMSVWTKTERLTEEKQGAAGTAISVDISFQYRLRPEELSDLYASVALAYAPFIENVATTVIKNVSTSFTAEEWTKDRVAIQQSLRENVDAALNRAHADCKLLQLRKVSFPATYVQRMLAAAVQIQSNQAEESRQQSKLIRDQTELEVKKVENEANLVRDTAYAKANLTITQAKSRVQAENNKAEQFKQEAALIRTETDRQAAEINNEAIKVLRFAEAEAEKTKALAQNYYTQRVDQARSEGLKNVTAALGIVAPGQKVSLDYIIKLIESNENVESFIGMPADLRTAATQA